jgi:hypothetical protein
MSILATGLARAAMDAFGWPAWQSGAAAGTTDSASAGAADAGDELTLSPAVQSTGEGLLSETLLARLFPGVQGQSGGNIRPEDLRQYYADQQESLNRRIQSLLANESVETPPEIRLQVGADGSVVVAGDHPDRRQIEDLFRENPRLRNQFVEVAALGEQIRAIDEAIAFQKAYAANPQAAVEAFSHLFSGSEPPKYTLVVGADAATVQFA